MKFNNLPRRLATKLGSLRLVDRRKLYALWEAEHLRHLLPFCAVDCVFDVGANTGQYGEMLRRKARFTGLIISFEPNPEAAAQARRRSSGDSKWIVEESALSSADGTQSFNVMREPQFSSFSSPRASKDLAMFAEKNVVERSIEVRTETLTSAYDRLQAKHGFSRPFLKMDTQGFDTTIVRHAGPALQRFVGLQSELAVRRLYSDSVDFREALSLYESLGFELSAFAPNNEGHFPHLMEIDCIMVRRDSST